MGIESRDYYRDASRYTDRLSGWGGGGMPPVCKWLIIINVVVFLLQIFVTRPAQRDGLQTYLPQLKELYEEGEDEPVIELPAFSYFPRVSVVQEWLQLETRKVLRGQVWRLLTNAFCHDRLSIWHLLFNMLFLYWFGLTLEAMYGSREFLLFYLAAAVIASLAYMGLDLITGEFLPAIGASGSVMAVTMLYAIHYPRSIIYLFFVIPVEVRWLVLFYVIFDLHPVLLALAGDHVVTGIAHAAHLGGLAFGFLYWRFSLRLEDYVDWLRMPRWSRLFGPRRAIRLHRPGPSRPLQEARDSPLEAQVDEILRRIHDQGEASLSERDREILATASRRYQNRARRSADPSRNPRDD